MSNITTTSAPEIQKCPFVHDYPDIILGSFIMIASFISYIPQYRKMTKSRSIQGLSHLMIILANLSSFTNFEGTILLDEHYYACCRQNNLTASQCINTFLPVIQMSVPWFSGFIYYFIYTIISEKDQRVSRDQELRIRYSFLAYIIIGPIFTGLLGTILLITTGTLHNHPFVFGTTLNIISSVLCFVMWIPQIIITYRTKSIGSLSLVTLGVQGPGALLVFIYQNIINKNSWSVGVPFLLSGTQIIILLCLGYYYTYGLPQCFRCCRRSGYINIDKVNYNIEPASSISVNIINND
jgi:uncharacterized protein with PQ loop repeat